MSETLELENPFDPKCKRCLGSLIPNKSKKSRLCNCLKGVGGSKGGSNDSASEGSSKKDNEQNASRSHDDDDIHRTDDSYFSDKESNKWARLVMRKPAALTLEEILKLLTFQIGADGTLIFQPMPGLSGEQHAAIKYLLNELKHGRGLEAFKHFLKKEKGISLDGFDINLSIKGETLTVSIPNPAQRKKFIEQMIAKNYLRPEPQPAQEPEHQFATPFRKNPFSTRLVRE